MRDLRIFSFCLVRESDLSKPAKLQLLNFLKEASDAQVKLFIVTGEVGQVSKVDEAKLDEQLSEVVATSAVAAYIASDIVFSKALNIATQKYNYWFGEAAKACGNKIGKEKKLCKKRFILRSYHEKLRALKGEAPKCSQTSNPEKCRKMFIKKIKEIEKQITKARTKY